MTSGLRTFAVGLGAALAVAAPAALVAQILDAVTDGDLAVAVTVPLALVVLLGAPVGGWAAVRDGGSTSLPLMAGIGAVAMGLVAALGAVRQQVADEDVTWEALPATVVLGACLALVGASLGRRGRQADRRAAPSAQRRG